jgi:hypothetical protein
MFVAISNIIATLAGFGLIAGLIWIARHGHADRDAEDAARAHFDAHGRWPDD